MVSTTESGTSRQVFLKKLFSIGLPIAVQFFITAAVNLIDNMMLGRLGEDTVAAAGAVNQIFFVLQIICFGINSGASVFMAQFWGAKDLRNTRRTISMMFILALCASLIFVLGATLLPRQLVSLYVHEEQVIALAEQYLGILVWSFPIACMSFALSSACRCTGSVHLPMRASMLAIFVNCGGNALLIFGLLGLPALGIRGAAIATVISRVAELTLLVCSVRSKHLPAAIGLKDFAALDKPFVKHYVKTTWPVLLNETMWSTGVSLYSVAYGRLGTDALAATQISSTIIQLLNVFSRGFSNATGIIIGNLVGAHEDEEARRTAKRMLVIMPLAGVVLCLLTLGTTPLFLKLYKVSDETLMLARQVLTVQGCSMMTRSLSMVLVVGICRSGGDIVRAAVCDVGAVWLVAMPLGFLSVHLGFPLWGVAVCVACEDVAKISTLLPRVLSGKWVKNVADKIR